MPVSSVQYGQVPWNYANGLMISNNATTPNTKLDIASGSILDSSGVYQLESDASITINAAANGLNGLDTGSLAASTLYKVFMVADPVTQQPIGAMISASSSPLLPYGYSVYKLIGYIATDASSHFLLGYWTAGNSAYRKFVYDAPQATAITAGADTSYTGVVLTAFVPAVANTPVSIAFDMTPSAASRIFYMQPYGATGDAVKITSQVTAVHVTGNAEVFARLNSGVPTINYKWSAGGGDAVAINVAGYDFFI